MGLQEDPAAAFASLMSQAADTEPPAPKDEAPFGYMTDPETGEQRPKKRPGRQRKPPTVDELKAQAAGQPEDETGPADRAPDTSRKRRKTGTALAKPEPEAAPPYRPGVIARGMNKRYRQLGKLVRAMDPAVGGALVSMAENTADDGEDDSVGAAWEELARSNPRIRRFCLRMVQGGAWGGLMMAHMPLFIALGMKFVSADPGFFGKLIVSMAEPDPDTPAGEGGLPGGMTAADAQQMMAMMAGMFPAGS